MTKIGFDAKRAFLNRTGLGNYSRWLIDGLVKFHPENEYLLYTPRWSSVFVPQAVNLTVKSPASKFLLSWWRSVGIIKDLQQHGVEIYHGLSHELPYGLKKTTIKSLVTVHDVIAFRFPQYFGFINRFIYKRKLTYACSIADKIVAVSQKTKDDLVELLGIAPTKIVVIYQGCDPSFRDKCPDEKLAEVKARYNLPEQYLLSVGTIEERKNLLLLVKALKNVPDVKLVVVGKPTAYLEKVKSYISENNLGNRIIFLHGLPFADLPAIYQGAACFIYPSHYEGFGIPVLEALVSGVPAIAATGSCLEEAGGPSSIYVGSDDDTALATQIKKVLANKQLRIDMIAAGLKYSANFDDEKLIQQYADLYQNVLKHA